MKKLLAVLVTALMTVSLFAACDRPLNTDVNDGREMLSTTAATQKTTKKKTTTTVTAKTVVKNPTEQELKNGYFDVIAGIEKGTSGASLKEAQAAVAVFQFAQEYAIANCDIEDLRDDMLDTWQEAMTQEERDAFDAAFMGVVELLDKTRDDYASVSGVLEDAGVKETMNELRRGASAWENWDTLKANTLTMGNSDGD